MSKTALNGWLILDKPTGITSAKAVSNVKTLLRPVKIGHAGTLDPLASGILPLALGEATKTAGYMTGAGKTYRFTVKWGAQSSTDDLEGEIIHTSDERPSIEQIKAILPEFTGPILQTPPNFSAIKVKGKRAYDLARDGKAVQLEARTVQIDSLSIVENTQNSTTFHCTCSKGTYIRSLARDMGQLLGCYGHITMLRREKVGKFGENHAISLALLEEMVHKDDLSFLLAVDAALDDIPALEITPNQAEQLMQGRTLAAPNIVAEMLLAKCEKTPIALCRIVDGQLKPARVFNLYDKGEYDVESRAEKQRRDH